jgi:Predicted Zn-dependent proteases and their inactivated homologs
MITDIPCDKVIQAAMRYGADFAEIFVERTSATWITCDDRRLEQAASFYDLGVGIRVIADGHTAYGSTNNLSRRSLLALAADTAVRLHLYQHHRYSGLIYPRVRPPAFHWLVYGSPDTNRDQNGSDGNRGDPRSNQGNYKTE